ncbi:hypothetical protein CLV30_12558 [Haloactinopolyspora alba]|uniref:Uncharacterized protein n=1 Tax=Haloactinopolyspora alba TaxID=648780 RepID=A0A2P8DHI5_9ACTN|nr:hypothetical protein [Haloactinopolyspora alba]PSK96676.1 hypothetical protein CLV30_12558 [Haloactinopolyspora alba]
MTAAEIPVPTAVSVQPEPDGRLAQLLGEYDAAKAWADEANARFEAVKDGIKAELAAAAPGVDQVDVASPSLQQPLRLVHVERWSLDSKRMKAEDPESYVRYARKSGTWQLRAVK